MSGKNIQMEDSSLQLRSTVICRKMEQSGDGEVILSCGFYNIADKFHNDWSSLIRT